MEASPVFGRQPGVARRAPQNDGGAAFAGRRNRL